MQETSIYLSIQNPLYFFVLFLFTVKETVCLFCISEFQF